MAKKNPWKLGVLTVAGLAAVGCAVYGGIALHDHFTKPAEEVQEEVEQTPEEGEEEAEGSVATSNYMKAIDEALAKI